MLGRAMRTLMLLDYPTLKPPVAWRIRERDVTDGLSKTAACSEHLSNDGSGYSPDERRNQYYFGDGFTPKTLPQLANECQTLGAVTSFTFGLGGNWLGPNYEFGNTPALDDAEQTPLPVRRHRDGIPVGAQRGEYGG